MTTPSRITITSEGGEFGAHLVRPEGGEGPGVLVLQEIFGVNLYIRDVCDRLAALGYIALAPDMFWRQKPGIDLSAFDENDLKEGMGYGMAFDAEAGIADIGSALATLRLLDGTGGKAGVLGFCFGGTFAYLAAVHHDPDVAVSYYGSGVAAAIGDIDKVACPLQFHFGGSDPYIPNADVERIAAAVAGHPDMELHVQAGGGHAFDNSFSAMFSHPPSGAAAWELTTAFLASHLA